MYNPGLPTLLAKGPGVEGSHDVLLNDSLQESSEAIDPRGIPWKSILHGVFLLLLSPRVRLAEQKTDFESRSARERVESSAEGL